MNPLDPIYTVQTECQDCYKCVRECPVKAIEVKDGHAGVIAQDCILCGHCVSVCPMQAKKIRSDLERAKQLIKRKQKVIVSLAPSFRSEFPEVSDTQMIEALKQLGFFAVSETALGAQIVSSHVAIKIQEQGAGVYISSACPVVVDYIKKYRKMNAGSLTEVLSPVLAHCAYLQELYGKESEIVFISPCIAKKDEADTHQELLKIALTFNDLRLWFAEQEIVPELIKTKDSDTWVPEKAKEGALYPVDGGMISGIKAVIKDPAKVFFMAVSGMETIKQTLTDIDILEKERPVFIEALACEGGCINGPAVKKRTATAVKRYTVIKNCDYNNEKKKLNPILPDIRMLIEPKKSTLKEFTDKEITAVLHSLGKHKDTDELNCSGCGYDTCRDLAAAYLNHRAEKTMCVSYMRKLAQKKASALLHAMPAGVVIVNNAGQILECNRPFAQLMSPEVLDLYTELGNLDNAKIEKIFPFSDAFKHVLQTGKNIIDKEYHSEKAVYLVTIFTIEPKVVVGGIIQDITQPATHKRHIVQKSQEVIKKNLKTVQQIAYLLGENAAESEVLLNSIIKSFNLEKKDGTDNP